MQLICIYDQQSSLINNLYHPRRCATPYLRDVQLSTEEQRFGSLLLKILFSKPPLSPGLQKVAHGVNFERDGCISMHPGAKHSELDICLFMLDLVAGMLAAAQPLRFYAVRVALRPGGYHCKYAVYPKGSTCAFSQLNLSLRGMT